MIEYQKAWRRYNRLKRGLIALFVLAPCTLSGQLPKRLTACEVIQQGRKLDEKIVSFPGIVELADPGTPDERFDNVVLTCGNKEVKIKIHGAETRFLSNPPAGFKFDTVSLMKVYRMLEDASKRGRVVTRFQATVEARISYVPEHQKGGPEPIYHSNDQDPVYVIVQALRNVRLLYDSN